MWADRPTGANRLLGGDYPLSSVERSMTALREQALVCLALILVSPAVALLTDRASALALLIAALLVEAGLCAGMGIMRSVRRQRIHDLIMAGSAPALDIGRAEMRRLADPGHRNSLRRPSRSALHDGEHWGRVHARGTPAARRAEPPRARADHPRDRLPAARRRGPGPGRSSWSSGSCEAASAPRCTAPNASGSTSS